MHRTSTPRHISDYIDQPPTDRPRHTQFYWLHHRRVTDQNAQVNKHILGRNRRNLGLVDLDSILAQALERPRARTSGANLEHGVGDGETGSRPAPDF
jgi:hypothetical protein